MKRFLISAAAVAAMATALAACGGSGNDSASGSTSSGGTATVSSKDLGSLGAVLVDRSGKPLYASDQETAKGMALCTTAACTAFWKPLTVTGTSPTGNSVSGTLGVQKRPDGMRQVSLDGKLLYSFSEDTSGQATGDGFQDSFGGQTFTWHVVHADGSVGTDTSRSSGSGYGY
jgi:predicted lipoprotein with Yx(FWY)xxD motif